MRNRLSIRLKTAPCWMGLLAVCLTVPTLSQAQPSAPSDSAVVLDRVVAVVNNYAILASDVDEEMQLAVLDPNQAGLTPLTRPRALEQLIERALIQQQIRQQDEQPPSQSEVDARLAEIRKELPACVRRNCATEEGWKAFLTAHNLTARRVESYLRYRLQILSFIELRFRQGIQIPAEDIATYYRKTLVPQYVAGEAIPPLSAVSPRIEEILLQQRVNLLFDDWLNNLRKQGDVEVLDPSLVSQEAELTGGKEGKP